MMSHIIMQMYLKFHCQKVDLTEMATSSIIWEILDSDLETGRNSSKSRVSRVIQES